MRKALENGTQETPEAKPRRPVKRTLFRAPSPSPSPPTEPTPDTETEEIPSTQVTAHKKEEEEVMSDAPVEAKPTDQAKMPETRPSDSTSGDETTPNVTNTQEGSSQEPTPKAEIMKITVTSLFVCVVHAHVRLCMCTIFLLHQCLLHREI